MAEDDRVRWDARYAERPGLSVEAVRPPSAFADLADRFPTSGSALELACGDGGGAAWLAARGLDVLAVDVSAEAVSRGRDLVARVGLAERCRFDVVDLDGGLPPGPPVGLLVCHLFSAPDLDEGMVARLVPGGLLAVAVLGGRGAAPGRFRAAPGALLDRFDALEVEVLDHREGDGVARLLARHR